MSKETVEDTYPLTLMQQGMLFNSLYAPQSGVDIEQMVITLPEEVDAGALERSLQEMVDRHPVLRTNFRWEGLEEPLQEVRRGIRCSLTQYDCLASANGAPSDRLKAFLREDRQRGFDLGRAPLIRFALFRLGESDYQFVLTFHHAILDGRSFPVLVIEEIFALYEGICRGQAATLPERRPYRDFIDWLRGQDWSSAKEYWKQTLKGFTGATHFAVDKIPGRTPGTGHGEHEFFVPASLTTALTGLVEQHSLTLNTFIQGAWAILLSRYSGEEDVAFGVTRACRESALNGAANAMVGLFINTVPQRVRVPADAQLLPWLKALRAANIAVRPYEHTPLIKIQEWSEVPRGTPLFESLVVFEKYQLNDAFHSLGGKWSNRDFRLLEQPNFPLNVLAYGGTEIQIKILHDRERFDDDTIVRMGGHFQTVLEGMAANPERSLGCLPLVTAAERQELIVEWNDTRTDYPRDRCLHHLFEDQARRTPEAVALVTEDQQIAYRELNERANRLAHHLRSLGVKPGTLVGICVARSPEMIVGVLAILKAGGAYVPLDPAYPKDRLAFMIEDTKAPLLVTQQALLDKLPASSAQVVCLDTLTDTLARESTDNPAGGADTNSLAYIIYTSGSTGIPKGVVLRHNPVVNLIDWVNRTFAVGPGDRLLFVTSLNFDLSVYDIFGILATGGSIRVTTTADLKDGQRLLAILCQEPITFWDSAPPMLQQLVPFLTSVPKSARTNHLRLVFLSGDWIPVAMPDQVRAAFPKARIVSLGGATEAAIWSNFYKIGTVDPAWPSIPYGKPIQNARYHILDAGLEPMPIGVPAELHIGGLCLAEGYLNRPELTSEKFIPDPFFNEPGARLYKTGDLARYLPDGNIEFLGRIDNQVKIRGFRIELGEIEAVVSQHPSVRDSVVVARKSETGDRFLAAYVVPRPGETLVAAELRKFVAGKLPEHMVPAHFVTLDVLPLNPNGKIDRKALPAPDAVQAQGPRTLVAPRYDVERDLAAIWEDVLKVKPIGVTDNFFELGGHSLLAAVLIARIKTQLGPSLPLGFLFEAPTVEQMASRLQHNLEVGIGSPVVPLREEGSNPPLFLVSGIGGHVFTFHKLVRMLGPEQPAYGIKAIGVDGERAPLDRIEDIAAEYLKEIVALRPQGPYILGGYSVGALVAYELALQMQAQGKKVPSIVIFDMLAPGYPKKLPRHRRALIHLKNFLRASGQEKIKYVGERLHNVKARVLRKLGLGTMLAPDLDVEEKPAAQKTFLGRVKTTLTHTDPKDTEWILKRVWAFLDVAMKKYRTEKKFEGDIVLLKAEAGFAYAATVIDDPELGWGERITGKVEIYMTPGDHLALLNDDNIVLLAGKIKESIEKALQS